MPGFVLQTAPVPAELAEPAIRVGFTVSRKVGNAVVRNRVRRRLREAAQLEMPQQARPDLDYVLVGRQAALALALAVGLPPAVRVNRLRIVDALAGHR